MSLRLIRLTNHSQAAPGVPPVVKGISATRKYVKPLIGKSQEETAAQLASATG
jgi:hypothetical protein